MNRTVNGGDDGDSRLADLEQKVERIALDVRRILDMLAAIGAATVNVYDDYSQR